MIICIFRIWYRYSDCILRIITHIAMISLVIPTIKDHTIKNLLACMTDQRITQIILVNLLITTQQQHDDYKLWIDREIDLISWYSSWLSWRAALARNLGIVAATGEYILCIDDDNTCDHDMISRLIDRYHTLDHPKTVLMTTTMLWHTWLIQQQGIVSYWHILSRPEPYIAFNILARYRKQFFGTAAKVTNNTLSILANWGNCFFAKSDILKNHLFDESFDFVYEDLERVSRWVQSEIYFCTALDIPTYHHESKSWHLAHSFLGTPNLVYQKTRNRIRYSRRTAHIAEYILFLFFGLPRMIWWTLCQIIISSADKIWSIQSLIRWVRYGLFQKLHFKFLGKYQFDHVLLTWYYGYHNLGDELMLLSVIKDLQTHTKHITVHTPDPARLEQRCERHHVCVDFLQTWYLSQFVYWWTHDVHIVICAWEILNSKYGLFRSGLHIILGWLKQVLTKNYSLWWGITAPHKMINIVISLSLMARMRDTISYLHAKKYTQAGLYHDRVHDIIIDRKSEIGRASCRERV